jgi:Chaperone of endosialidase
MMGLVLLLWGGLSWGQVPSTNDVSDHHQNTAGGTGALEATNICPTCGGNYNTAYGYQALYSNDYGRGNTASGYETLYHNNTGFFNTASGYRALYNNLDSYHNTAFGAYALYSSTWGGNNTASGYQALYSNNGGSSNTASGYQALYSNIGGSSNTASGYRALYNSRGSYNTASGYEALQGNTTGTSNTASGYRALYNNDGDYNTAYGTDTLGSNTTGSYNTAYGTDTLGSNTTGHGNIALGYRAGFNLTGGSNNIYLGNTGVATESKTMRLGQGQTRTFIAGIASVPMSGSAVVISSTGQLGIQVSSARYKHDIQPMGARSQGLFQLRPVTFRYMNDPQGQRQYGLIAEEVAKVYPELITRDANGEVESVRYQELIPMLLNELQHQQQQVVELRTQHERLRTIAVQLQKREKAQQAQNAALAARLERLEEAAARAAVLASR